VERELRVCVDCNCAIEIIYGVIWPKGETLCFIYEQLQCFV